MHLTAQQPVGAVAQDVDLRDVTDVTALRDALAEHGAIAFPEQDLDDAALVALLRRFGDIAFTEGETAVPGRPELNVVTNVGRGAPPRSSFHVDTSYVARPPSYTALRAVAVPDQGGETLFTNQYRALETLPDDLAQQIAGRTMTHVMTGLDPATVHEASATHPLVRPHPRTRRPSLYLTVPTRCAAVSGLDDQEAARLVERLYEHSTVEANIWRHRWRHGDVVIWDNACVLHRADHRGVRGDRTMHRGMVDATAYAA